MNQVLDHATPRTRITRMVVVQSGVGHSTAGNPFLEAPEATVPEATAVIALPEIEPRSFRAR